jgi:predicted ATP-grasp superfamily ATP-dependent carboligase
MRSGALVTGASYRALAVVRSLGRHGIDVRVVRSDEHALAQASRYASGRLSWPATADAARRVQYLLDLAEGERLHGWVLIPTHDEEAALIARHRETLARRYRLTTPAWETLRAAYDKRSTYALGARVGLDQPWTVFPDGESALEQAEGRFPVVIKPAYKSSLNRLTVDKAWRADDPETLRRLYRRACSLVDPRILMLQQLVAGNGESQLSYAALCSDGKVVASLSARRLRQYPMDFGRASSHVETIDDPGLEHDATRLVRALGFTGMLEVEFKRDPVRGVNLLLDVNPRAWGWQSLGGRAGVDFPYLLWRLANGDSIPPTRAAPGVRWVRTGTDLLAVAGELAAGRLSLREYLRSLRRPLEFAVFAPDDPLPSLAGPVLTARTVARRLAAGRPV